MSKSSGYPTPQEQFWAGEFGTDYIARNRSEALLASNLAFFSKALERAGSIGSCAEIGANVGMNLKALRLLYPGLRCSAVEINADAARELGSLIGEENVFNGSIADWHPRSPADLALSKGVLIHLKPGQLPTAYDRLYAASLRLILIAEYYSPVPTAVPYRGHEDRLFKRDFAGEMLDRFSDLRLIDYGFCYRRDPAFPQDDINWFLLEKARA
ncbi:MAG: pseudaminic acid biosynthesis-associated methylase [Sphingomicrobium sp.]